MVLLQIILLQLGEFPYLRFQISKLNTFKLVLYRCQCFVYWKLLILQDFLTLAQSQCFASTSFPPISPCALLSVLDQFLFIYPHKSKPCHVAETFSSENAKTEHLGAFACIHAVSMLFCNDSHLLFLIFNSTRWTDPPNFLSAKDLLPENQYTQTSTLAQAIIQASLFFPNSFRRPRMDARNNTLHLQKQLMELG